MVSEELINNVKRVSEKCEFARFAPSAVGNDSGGELFKSVESIILEIESTLKSKK